MIRRCIAILFVITIGLAFPSADLWAGSRHSNNYTQIGKASHYRGKYLSAPTPKGKRGKKAMFTAAHRTLPFGTKVKVTNLSTGKSVLVVINDRGPFIRGRIIDLSTSAFKQIGNLKNGHVRVKLETVST